MRGRKTPIYRRGRVALLWGLTGFVLLQLGLALAIERWLPELRDPDFGYRVTRLYRRTVPVPQRPFTAVMLGSSRTTLGFRADHLEASLTRALGHPVVVFNFGITGAGPLMELLDLRRLLERHIRPDLLLVEVLPPLLDGHSPHERLRLPVTRLWLPELKLLGHYGASVTDLQWRWWQAWPVPWYTHRFGILSRVAPACLPYQLRMDWLYRIDDSGWVNSPVSRGTPERYRQAVQQAHNEYIGHLLGFRLEGNSATALRELLGLCRHHAIPTVLVLMPEGSEFRSWYPPEVWGRMERFLDDLSREYAAPVINARTWVSDEDFSDSHHLLPQGAAAFTERLGRDALLPLIHAKASGSTGGLGRPTRRE